MHCFPTLSNRLAVALALTVAAGVAQADECQRMKLRTVGKVELVRLVCHARVAASSDASRLPTCEGKATAKFQAAFAKAGTCMGDQTRCTDMASACVAAVTALLSEPLPSACEAVKRKAAGRLAKKSLDCYAKAARSGESVDETCIASARDRFALAVTRAGTCPDGSSPQSEIEAYCVLPVVGSGEIVEVCPASATSSTSTTSSSTSSTTTTSTLPFSPCDDPGLPCGSCGTGFCLPSCTDPQAGTCVDWPSSLPCVTEQDCADAPGTACVSAPFCIAVGCACQGRCVAPCP